MCVNDKIKVSKQMISRVERNAEVTSSLQIGEVCTCENSKLTEFEEIDATFP